MSSTTTNELGGCDYVRYEDLESISLPTSACEYHVDSLKERLQNQADWKGQFNALTEIQRIAKYQPTYFGISLKQPNTVPLDAWFGPLLACVNSLRSSLSMHALVTLSVLTFSEECRVQLASLLVRAARPSPVSSPGADSPPQAVKAGRAPVKIASRMMNVFGTLIAEASSPAKSKFIQQKAEEVACQVAAIPKVLEPLLPTALKLAKDNIRNSRYLFRLSGVIAAAWEAESKRRLSPISSQEMELSASPEFEGVVTGLVQIGAMAIGDKLVDTRTRGKTLLKKLQDFADAYDVNLNKAQAASEIQQQQIPGLSASMVDMVKRVFETLSSSMDSAARAAFQKSFSYCESHSCSSIGQRSRGASSMRLRAPLGRSRVASDFGPPSSLESSCKMTDMTTTHLSKSTSQVPLPPRSQDRETRGPQLHIPPTQLPTRGREQQLSTRADERDRSPSVECLGSLDGPPLRCPPSESIWSAESSNKYTDQDYYGPQVVHRPPPRVPNPPSVPLSDAHSYAPQHVHNGSNSSTHARVPSVRMNRSSVRAPSLSRQSQQHPSYPRPRSGRSSIDGFADNGGALDSGGARSRYSADGGEGSTRRKLSSGGCPSGFPKAPTQTKFALGQPKPLQRLQSRERSIPPPATDPAAGKCIRRSIISGGRAPPASAQLADTLTENALPPLYNNQNALDNGGAVVRKRSVTTLTGNMRRLPSLPVVDHSMPGPVHVERTTLGGIKGVIPKAPVKLGSGSTVMDEDPPMMRRRVSMDGPSGAAVRRVSVEGGRRKVSMDRPLPPYRKQSFADRPPRCPGGGNGKLSAASAVPPLDIPSSNENRRGRTVIASATTAANPMEHSLGTLSTATGGSFRGQHHRSRSLTGHRPFVSTLPDEGIMRAFANKFGFVDSTTSEGD